MNRLELIEKLNRCHGDEVVMEFTTDRKILGYKPLVSVSDRWGGQVMIEVNIDDFSLEEREANERR